MRNYILYAKHLLTRLWPIIAEPRATKSLVHIEPSAAKLISESGTRPASPARHRLAPLLEGSYIIFAWFDRSFAFNTDYCIWPACHIVLLGMLGV